MLLSEGFSDKAARPSKIRPGFPEMRQARLDNEDFFATANFLLKLEK